MTTKEIIGAGALSFIALVLFVMSLFSGTSEPIEPIDWEMLVSATPVNITITELCPTDYAPNWTEINYSSIFNSTVLQSGNYSWNHTFLNLTPYNCTTSLFRFNNTAGVNVSVNMTLDVSDPWYNWTCNEITLLQGENNINITIPINDTRDMNCTLDLNDISQTYVGWVQTEDNASWNLSHSFTTTQDP